MKTRKTKSTRRSLLRSSDIHCTPTRTWRAPSSIVSIIFAASTPGRPEPLDKETFVVCLATHCHQGQRRRDMSSEETCKNLVAMVVLIMDQGREFGAEFPRFCHYRDILSIVCDLEALWQNAATERNGARFKIAFGKACGYETPTTEAEVGEFIDFTFTELNRRVGRAGFAPRQSFGGGCDCHTVETCCNVSSLLSDFPRLVLRRFLHRSFHSTFVPALFCGIPQGKQAVITARARGAPWIRISRATYDFHWTGR